MPETMSEAPEVMTELRQLATAWEEIAPLISGTTGVMATIDRSGDTKVKWDRSKPDEVEAARMQFNYLKKKGYAAHKLTGPGDDQGEMIKDFDPAVERMVMVPVMAGG